MNIFVLCTGRCGSATFAAACRPMSNYCVSHESLGSRCPSYDRYRVLDYPDNHIEVDNRLSWFLGAIDDQFGKEAFYVHLLRDREEVARSFVKRWENRTTNIIYSFAWGMLSHRFDEVANMHESDRLRISRQYWDVVNQNIRLFLRDKPRQITMWLHDIEEPFQEFWHRIEADGNLSKALSVWDTRHNASPTPCVTAPCGNRDDSPESDADGGRVCHELEEAEAVAKEVRTSETAINAAAESFACVALEDLHLPSDRSSWTLTDNVLRFLIRLIEQLEPRHIVEFGSGLSTRVLAAAASRFNSMVRITSIDHDPEFIERTQRLMGNVCRETDVMFLYAPLVTRQIAGEFLPRYHFAREALAQRGPADLVLIDGPPRSLGGREGTLYQVMDLARAGTIVVLDDACRPEERSSIANWHRSFGSAIRTRWLKDFEKGLATVTIVEPIPSTSVPPLGVGAAVRELNRRIAPGEEWIVVDDGQLDPAIFAGKSVLPFLERDGQYWGPPSADVQAIEELEGLRQRGAAYLAFLSSSFWWLEHYPGLQRHLDAHFHCDLREEHLVIYDLRENKP